MAGPAVEEALRYEPAGPGQTSCTKCVPAAVPALSQSSGPCIQARLGALLGSSWRFFARRIQVTGHLTPSVFRRYDITTDENVRQGLATEPRRGPPASGGS